MSWSVWMVSTVAILECKLTAFSVPGELRNRNVGAVYTRNEMLWALHREKHCNALKVIHFKTMQYNCMLIVLALKKSIWLWWVDTRDTCTCTCMEIPSWYLHGTCIYALCFLTLFQIGFPYIIWSVHVQNIHVYSHVHAYMYIIEDIMCVHYCHSQNCLTMTQVV